MLLSTVQKKKCSYRSIESVVHLQVMITAFSEELLSYLQEQNIFFRQISSNVYATYTIKFSDYKKYNAWANYSAWVFSFLRYGTNGTVAVVVDCFSMAHVLNICISLYIFQAIHRLKWISIFFFILWWKCDEYCFKKGNGLFEPFICLLLWSCIDCSRYS